MIFYCLLIMENIKAKSLMIILVTNKKIFDFLLDIKKYYNI